jgi:Zn-dependent M28 family amino/carboxypeptidase
MEAVDLSVETDVVFVGYGLPDDLTKNVIGVIEGSDPKLKNEYILLSAHYDHVGVKHDTNGEDSIYNGARDNAIGVAAILGAAQSLAEAPAKRPILLLACTGEEKGLLGSKWYAEHPPVPLNQIVYNLNIDGGGYNDITKVSVMGLTRTSAEQQITSSAKAFGLDPIADPTPEQNLFDRSDNVSFAAKGIPAPTYGPGFTSFDDEILKYYHQVTDNAETLDFDYLAKFFLSYALLVRRVANMEVTPFWTPGDKYEEAGKKLYGIK